MVRHRFEPPRMEDYLTEEEYEEALKKWEWREDEYAEECREAMLLEDLE